MKNLIVILLFASFSATAQKLQDTQLNIKRVFVTGEEMSCDLYKVQYVVKSKRVIVKAEGTDLDLKIKKKKVDKYGSWLGQTPAGEYFLITPCYIDGYFSIIFHPVEKDTSLRTDIPAIIVSASPNLCKK